MGRPRKSRTKEAKLRYVYDRTQLLISLGRCITCGRKLDRQGRRCLACHETVLRSTKAWRRYLIAMGLCYGCGKPRDSERMNCKECLEKYRSYRAMRSAVEAAKRSRPVPDLR